MMGSSYKIGLTYYLCMYSTGLKRLGHNVVVISGQTEQAQGLFDRLKEHGIKYYVSSNIDKRTPYGIYRAAKEIRCILKSENIDIMHVNGFFHMLKGYFACRAIGTANKIPIAFMVHSVHHGTKYERLACLIGSRLMNWCADIIMPVSEWLKIKLIQGGLRPDKVITVHNAIDFEKFNLQVSANDDLDIPGIKRSLFSRKTIACLAQLIPRKGIEYLILSVPQIIRAFPDTVFINMGDGPLKRKLEMMTKKLDIEKNVCFTGKVGNDYIPGILRHIDIGVVSSLSETFGHAIIEPMAAAKPVVTTPVGVAQEIVEDGKTGVMVPPRDAEALAKAIIMLLRDEEKAREIGMRARALVEEKFNLNTIAANLINTYNFALER